MPVKKYRLLVLLVLILIMGGVAGCAPYEYHGVVLDTPRAIPDTVLLTHTGTEFTLHDFPSQVTFVYFGYTFCPDFCPSTLYEVSQMMNDLGEDAKNVQFIMVSVDPERDTADQLGNYVTNFNDSFIGAQARNDADLDALLSEFGAYYFIEDVAEESAAGYLVSHTVSSFLLDQDGKLRIIYQHGVPGEDLAQDVRQFLKN